MSEKAVYSIYVDKRLMDKLDSVASKDFRTRNNLIEKILAEKLGMNPEEFKPAKK